MVEPTPNDSKVDPKRKSLTTELRAAIWETHNKRCVYTGDLIAFSELEIDHIIPIGIESSELNRLASDGIIVPNFDLNGLGNLLPTKRFQNGRKSAHIRSNSVLLHFLDIAEQYRSSIENRLSDSLADRKLLSAYLQLKAAADRNSIAVEDVVDIHRQQEGLTRLRHAPELENCDDLTLLNAELAIELMNKPFALGGGGIDVVFVQNDAGECTACTNCAEFLTAQDLGLWPMSQFEINCYGMADQNCSMLSALQHAKFAPESVLRYPRVTCKNLDRWSSEWVRQVWIEFDEQRDGEMFRRCKTIADLAAEGACKVVRQDEWSFAIEPRRGFAVAISELFRADLDDDGLEEILIANLAYAPNGTFRANSVEIAKPDESGVLQPPDNESANN